MTGEVIQFDKEVIKLKAKHTITYSPSLTKEIFQEKLSSDVKKYEMPNAKERLERFKKKQFKIMVERQYKARNPEIIELPVPIQKSASANGLCENIDSLPLTETEAKDDIFITENQMEESEWDWDCQLIDELSENTARWMVMKKIERDG